MVQLFCIVFELRKHGKRLEITQIQITQIPCVKPVIPFYRRFSQKLTRSLPDIAEHICKINTRSDVKYEEVDVHRLVAILKTNNFGGGSGPCGLQ